MISETYDIREFLTAMIGKGYFDILSTAEEECRIAEARSYSVRGAPQQRKLGSTKYASQIKSFLYFMRFASRPGSASAWEWAMYKSVHESLVKRGDLSPEALDF